MKKQILAILLILVMSLSLFGCEKKEEVQIETFASVATVNTTTSEAPTEETTKQEETTVEETTVETAPETTVIVVTTTERSKPSAATAAAYIGQSAGALEAAIGSPLSKIYAPSCLSEGEDGIWYYDGFTVFTFRDLEGHETVTAVG